MTFYVKGAGLFGFGRNQNYDKLHLILLFLKRCPEIIEFKQDGGPLYSEIQMSFPFRGCLYCIAFEHYRDAGLSNIQIKKNEQDFESVVIEPYSSKMKIDDMICDVFNTARKYKLENNTSEI